MLYQITDQQNQGLAVATFDAPQGWQTESYVIWNVQNISLPAQIYAGTFNPDGTEAFEFLPVEAFYWLEPNWGNPIGQQSKYGLLCLPPTPAAETMMRYVVPKYRGNRNSLRVVGVQPIPDLPQILNAPELLPMQHEGVVVRLEYEEHGHTFTEEFCGVQTLQQAHGAMNVQINWGFARLFCYRAAKERFDAQRNLFWQIACSVRNNPQWQQLYQQIALQLNAQHGAFIAGWKAKLQSEADFQQQLTSYYQERRERQNADIAQKIASDQRRREPAPAHLTPLEQWRNELGGETAYQNPYGSEGNIIYHTSCDAVVWMNEHGERAGSPDPNFDPNPGSPHTWRRLREA